MPLFLFQILKFAMRRRNLDGEFARADIGKRDRSPPRRDVKLVNPAPEFMNWMNRAQDVFFERNPAPRREVSEETGDWEDWDDYKSRIVDWFATLPESERNRTDPAYPQMSAQESRGVQSFLNWSTAPTGRSRFTSIYGNSYDTLLDNLAEQQRTAQSYGFEAQEIMMRLEGDNEEKAMLGPIQMFKKYKDSF